MYADLSRVTHRADRHYSAVLAQQGRVQLDADLNEQAAIQVAAVRALAVDLIGSDGGPRDAAGFEITHVPRSGDPDDLTIGEGRYYVDGIACDATRPVRGVPVPDEGAPQEPEAPGAWTYWDQPNAFRDPELPGDRLPTDFPYLAYLKVWERCVTAAEDPALREIALGSATSDTTARAKVVWQVLAVPGDELEVGDNPNVVALRSAFFAWADRSNTPYMAARARRRDDGDVDSCLVGPDARYRGPENQLYRVEIHEGGTSAEATLKWSRENGSVVLPVDEIDGTWVDLAALGGDHKLDLSVGHWVEVADTAYLSRLEPLPLLRVEEVDFTARRVRLSDQPGPGVGHLAELHPYLRRWDHVGTHAGAVPLDAGDWMHLEDGVELYFASGDATYLPGDYWQIPARTATGDVEWPTDTAHRPLMLTPSGIAVHYAPLAWINGRGEQIDLRLTYPLLAEAADPEAKTTTSTKRTGSRRSTPRSTS